MKEIDVVLSGSGVKMMAFVGALKALEESNVEVIRIAGTSGGAIIASLYAYGLKSDQIKDIVMNWNFKWWVILGINLVSIFRGGILTSSPIENALKKIYGCVGFDKLKRELVITGSNINKGKTEFFRKPTDIKVAQAARISATIPAAYSYIKYKGDAYVDGGLFNNYPIDIFDDNERPTIGFKTSSLHPTRIKIRRGPISYLLTLLDAASSNSERVHIKYADWARTIPLDVNHITSASNFNITQEEKEELFKVGYDTTKKLLSSMI